MLKILSQEGEGVWYDLVRMNSNHLGVFEKSIPHRVLCDIRFELPTGKLQYKTIKKTIFNT